MEGRSLDDSKDSSAFRNNPDTFFMIKLSIFSFAHLLSFGYHFLSVFLHSVYLLAGLFFADSDLINSYSICFWFDPVPTVQLHLQNEPATIGRTPQHSASTRDGPSEKCIFYHGAVWHTALQQPLTPGLLHRFPESAGLCRGMLLYIWFHCTFVSKLNHIYLPWLEEVFPQVVFHFGLKRILF